MSSLQLPGNMGGLDLPDVRKYQLCALLQYIIDLARRSSSSIWLDIDSLMAKCPLSNLLFIKDMTTVKDWCGNPITVNKIKAWRAVQHTEGRAEITSTFTPFVSNPDFVPGVLH